jgi:hypothetical protein
LFSFVFSFRFGRIVHLKMSSLGEWLSQRVVGGMFWPLFFHLFSLILPPSHVPRRLPPLSPQDPVVSVARDRRVVPTRLRALCYLVRVWVTLRLFQAELGGNRLYGVEPPSGWHQCRCVSFTRRRPASWSSPPLLAACFE